MSPDVGRLVGLKRRACPCLNRHVIKGQKDLDEESQVGKVVE
jgi:hypothetical protein